VSRSFDVAVRSVVFNVLFYGNLIVHMIVALPTLALPYPILRSFIRSYAKTSLWLLRAVCGTKVEWRGLEKIPHGACILASKHQSVWETFAFFAVLPDPTYILKRELMWIPFYGWYARKARLIGVNRSAGLAALTRMTAQAQIELARERQLVIFPEGTRQAPGATPSYKPGVVHLYGKAGVPCVPMALNSGLFWPRRSLRRFPGTIVVQALDPIAPGLDRKTFLDRLENEVESATARLVAAGRQELAAHGITAPSPGSWR
jgi:1-acyl-sn-glycerol-3-phosphate acyltransferase